MTKTKAHREVVRIAGRLKEVITLKDAKGNVLHHVINPLMLEFRAKDFIQILVGASLLAVPVSLTEEVWKLGAELPLVNILLFLLMSVSFISCFVYYNYYRHEAFYLHRFEFLKRVLSTYILSFCVAALFLTLIDKAPWAVDLGLALKRCILVAFPASMSAAVADMVK